MQWTNTEKNASPEVWAANRSQHNAVRGREADWPVFCQRLCQTACSTIVKWATIQHTRAGSSVCTLKATACATKGSSGTAAHTSGATGLALWSGSLCTRGRPVWAAVRPHTA